jgi:SAM-dependent methyltransferase
LNRLVSRAIRDWRVKALLQKSISVLPRSADINYWFQRNVSKRLPVSDAEINASVGIAERYRQAFEAHVSRPISDAKFFEFGAGWDLRNPIALVAAGVRHQTVVDVRPLAKASLISDSLGRLAQAAGVSAPARSRLQALTEVPTGPHIADILPTLGIDYRAPCDARSTGLAAGSFDCVTSTAVLEHVPAPDIPAILRECRRLLAPDGIMICEIDYHDHYSSSDGEITPYNFLRFSPRRWRLFNSSLHFQNRLRHAEYRKLFLEAGFRVLEEETSEVGDRELEQLSSVPLWPEFREFDPAELAITQALLVLGNA